MAKFTKTAIMNSFLNMLEKRNFEKITVKDIVEDCGINRKTFYYYFADIYDLAEYVLRSEISKFSESIMPEATVESALNLFCDLIEKNKRIVMHSFSFSGENGIKGFLNEIFERSFKEMVRSAAGNRIVSEDDIETVARICAFGFIGSVFVWIDGGFKTEERERLKKTCVIMQGSIETMLDSLEKCN